MMAFMESRKTRYAVSLVVAVSVLFAVGSVYASGDGGMLNKPMDLLYRTMNFVVLIGVLIFLLKKPLGKALEARRQGIKDQLDDLKKQKQDAQAELKEYEDKLARLEQEVEGIVAQYVKDGEAVKAQIIEEAKAAAGKFQDQAKKNIEYEFASARKQLRAEMADQAITMAEELIKKNIKDEDQERILGEYLTKVVVAK